MKTMENERVIIITNRGVADTNRATVREMLAEIMKPESISNQPDFKADKITVAEAAKFAGISYPTVLRWINDGKIPVHGQGRTRFLLKSELTEALKKM